MATECSSPSPQKPTRVVCDGIEFLIIDGRRIWLNTPPEDYDFQSIGIRTGTNNCSRDCGACTNANP